MISTLSSFWIQKWVVVLELRALYRLSQVCSLYVHRCLVNLEQSDLNLNPAIPDIHVDPSLIPHDQWEWRKNYRVWEANRKVFLYPENYLEPDLRDNKTPLFKELEDELLQEKITKDSADVAYRKYVSQFAELARLVISGAYGDVIDVTNYYHLFGRTPQQPYQYYYRKLRIRTDETFFITPWEKIELAINSDRVSAVVHLGRLYIFWVEKMKKSKPTVVSGNMYEKWVHTRLLAFSSLNEFGKWMPPRKLLIPDKDNLYSYESDEDDEGDTFVYPVIKENNIYISFYDVHFDVHTGVHDFKVLSCQPFQKQIKRYGKSR